MNECVFLQFYLFYIIWYFIWEERLFELQVQFAYEMRTSKYKNSTSTQKSVYFMVGSLWRYDRNLYNAWFDFNRQVLMFEMVRKSGWTFGADYKNFFPLRVLGKCHSCCGTCFWNVTFPIDELFEEGIRVWRMYYGFLSMVRYQNWLQSLKHYNCCSIRKGASKLKIFMQC